MLNILAACAATAAATVAPTAGSGMAGQRAQTAAFTPPCPQVGYGADRNMDTLFCVVDNPVALRYFAPMAKRLFALGPNANPQQVVAAALADRRTTGTLPILCSSYRLAAWREHWQFAVSAADQIGLTLRVGFRGWCADPNFKISN